MTVVEILLARHLTQKILLRVLPRGLATTLVVRALVTKSLRTLQHLGTRPLLIGETLCGLPLTHHFHRLGQVNCPPSRRDNPTRPRLTPGPVVVVVMVMEAAAVAVAMVEVLENQSKTSTAQRN